MVRRHVLDQIGLLDPRLLQTQDFDFWIRLCLRFDIKIIREPLVQYRIRSDLANADANTPAKIARINWELPKALEQFCALEDADLFFRVFPEAREQAREGLRLKTLLALVALKAPHRWTRTFGIELLHREFADLETARALEAAGFGYPEFFRAVAEADASGAASVENAVARLLEAGSYLNEVTQARDYWHEQSDHWQAECTNIRAQALSESDPGIVNQPPMMPERILAWFRNRLG
jgi:hypothetical protein